MTLGILIFFLGIIVFHKQILFGVLIIWLRPEYQSESNDGDLLLRGQGFSPLHLYVSSTLSLEFVCFRHAFRGSLIVATDFWNRLDTNERQCLHIWAYVSSSHRSLIHRAVGPYSPFACDRDSLLLGAQSTAFFSTLEKARAFRKQQEKSLSQESLGGLSLLGSSLIQEWSHLEERAKRLSTEIQKLENQSKPEAAPGSH